MLGLVQVEFLPFYALEMPMNAVATDTQPLVGIIMGSQSDWATLEHTANMLKQLGVPFEAEVVSAHRTPTVCLNMQKLRVIVVFK